MAVADLDASGTPDLSLLQVQPGPDEDAWTLFTNGFDGADFLAPPSDFSEFTDNLDGTFTRRLKDGTEINYDADGLQTSIVNRNGNQTS